MVMSVTEADAAQKVLRYLSAHIAELRDQLASDDTELCEDEYGQQTTLSQVMEAGRILAVQSSKKLMAGIDGRQWDRLIDPDNDIADAVRGDVRPEAGDDDAPN